MPKFCKIIFPLVLTIVTSACTKQYNCDDIEFKDGYYRETATYEFATGTYNCSRDEHRYYNNYKNGKETGEWEYYFSDDLIHHGEIIENEVITNKLTKDFNADYSNINLWYEGDTPFLHFDIINPNSSFELLTREYLMETEIYTFMQLEEVDCASFCFFVDDEWECFELCLGE